MMNSDASKHDPEVPIPSFPISISPTAEQQAQQLAKACPFARQQQVYQNALAVFAVEHYLNCLGLETNSKSTELQEPLRRSLLDIADIILPNLGTIECCPVDPNRNHIRIPAETWHNRLAYIAVEIDCECHQATLLGFIDRLDISAMERANSEDVPLTVFRGIDELPEYLDGAKPFLVDLQQWWADVFQFGWHSVQELLNSPQLQPSLYRSQENSWLEQRMREFVEPDALASNFRSGHKEPISGYKVITLPSAHTQVPREPSKISPQDSIALVLHAVPHWKDELEISIEAIPGARQEYLPANLKLALLNQERIELLTARTQTQNRHLQLDFTGSIGDDVIVQLSIDNFSVEGKIIL